MHKKVDAFILGLITMILLAWIFPDPVLYEGSFSLDRLADYGIALIFFFYGLKLSPEEMKKGLGNYKLHVVIQISTFILFPLLVILLRPFSNSNEGHMIWLSIFFLAALPSTVSSSVVMVVMAKGNIPGAIFNASLSGLLGILITPLWMGLFMNTVNTSFDVYDIFIDLIIKILLPVIIGLIAHRFWGHFAKKHSKSLALFDKSIILIIVYKSFAKSFSSGLFQAIEWDNLLAVALAVSLLLSVVYLLIHWISQKIRLNREDRITALFCGSKKSLVHGSVMASVLFEGMAIQGLILLPIMLYHALQLIVISFIAQRMAKTIYK